MAGVPTRAQPTPTSPSRHIYLVRLRTAQLALSPGPSALPHHEPRMPHRPHVLEDLASLEHLQG